MDNNPTHLGAMPADILAEAVKVSREMNQRTIGGESLQQYYIARAILAERERGRN